MICTCSLTLRTDNIGQTQCQPEWLLNSFQSMHSHINFKYRSLIYAKAQTDVTYAGASFMPKLHMRLYKESSWSL